MTDTERHAQIGKLVEELSQTRQLVALYRRSIKGTVDDFRSLADLLSDNSGHPKALNGLRTLASAGGINRIIESVESLATQSRKLEELEQSAKDAGLRL